MEGLFRCEYKKSKVNVLTLLHYFTTTSGLKATFIRVIWLYFLFSVDQSSSNSGINDNKVPNHTCKRISSKPLQERGSEIEGMSYFERHAFVHVVAIIYLMLFILSLAPNLAVIVRLNQSMYRTIQRTLSKSTSQISTQDTTFRFVTICSKIRRVFISIVFHASWH